ncbi:MAG: HAMP domain-containing sensor histidine kinase [Planctomycetota bacterium]
MSPDRELAYLRLRAELTTVLEDVTDPEKVLQVAVRRLRQFFGAERAAVAVECPGPEPVTLAWAQPAEFVPDLGVFVDTLAGRPPGVGPNPLLIPIQRRGRIGAALALWREGASFDRDDMLQAAPLGKLVSQRVQVVDRDRISEMRARIDRQLMEQLRPKDLFYEVLGALQKLTRYDHSAALLVPTPTPNVFELVAEKITWRKGKSRRVGLTRVADDALQRLMELGEVAVFVRDGDQWRRAGDGEAEELADFLDYNRASPGKGEELERVILCAPLANRNEVVGVLKVAACWPGLLGAFEVDLVRRFLPKVAVAIRRMDRDVTLETGLLEAEKQRAMANLARGVAHDVNNAVGAVLPLVQQLAQEARAGTLDPATAAEDLAHIEASLDVCQRIFGGMLSFAKGSARAVGEGDLRRAVDRTLAILGDGMRSQGVEVSVVMPRGLPQVRGGQGDLEQLVLNLATNARDAMTEGGELTVEAAVRDGDVVLAVRDTGTGIDSELLAQIQEPFFSTKRHGYGLGLSICRSIVWNMDGEMLIDTHPGVGTTVTVRMPIVPAETELSA